jgi:hypothetical protein
MIKSMALLTRKKKDAPAQKSEGKVQKTEAKEGTKKRGQKGKEKVLEKGHQAPETVLVDKECIIKPDKFESIPLGQLDRGTLISVEAKEVNGENFSLYLMDIDNLKKYERDEYTKGAILKGTTISSYQHQIKISMKSKYFLVITSRAVEKERKIWVKVGMRSS